MGSEVVSEEVIMFAATGTESAAGGGTGWTDGSMADGRLWAGRTGPQGAD